MTDSHKWGTADELGRVDLGPFGAYVIEDDGDNDAWVTRTYEPPDAPHGAASFKSTVQQFRAEHGDRAVMDALDSLSSGGDAGSSGTTYRRSGPFVCPECGRTWPAKSNQTEGGGDPICPECAEGDA